MVDHDQTYTINLQNNANNVNKLNLLKCYQDFTRAIKRSSDNLKRQEEKTEEIVFDPKLVGNHSLTMIDSESIRQVSSVSSYKYSGLFNDNNLLWDVHFDNLYRKVQQKMYFFCYAGYAVVLSCLY